MPLPIWVGPDGSFAAVKDAPEDIIVERKLWRSGAERIIRSTVEIEN